MTRGKSYTHPAGRTNTMRRFRDMLEAAVAPRTESETQVMVNGSDGRFHVDARVGGHPIRFVVDTGATSTVLSPADAGRLGLDVDRLAYTEILHTANGVGAGALVTLHQVEIGGAVIAEVPAIVNRAPMGESLLGMSLLRRLDSFDVSGDRLTMRHGPSAPAAARAPAPVAPPIDAAALARHQARDEALAGIQALHHEATAAGFDPAFTARVLADSGAPDVARRRLGLAPTDGVAPVAPIGSNHGWDTAMAEAGAWRTLEDTGSDEGTRSAA